MCYGMILIPSSNLELTKSYKITTCNTWGHFTWRYVKSIFSNCHRDLQPIKNSDAFEGDMSMKRTEMKMATSKCEKKTPRKTKMDPKHDGWDEEFPASTMGMFCVHVHSQGCKHETSVKNTSKFVTQIRSETILRGFPGVPTRKLQ